MLRNLIFAALSGAAVALAACGGYGSTQGVTSSPTPAPASAMTISVASSKLGPILVDGNGRTLYLFGADQGMNSNCYGSCAQEWPPVLTSAQPLAGSGTASSLLGTTTRKDGGVEVTYAGHPLYYFVADTKSGDTKGQGINDSGGLWLVLSPDGSKVG